jgi:dihydroxyacetone kinase
MKKFINEPDNVVKQALAGMSLANEAIIDVNR